MHWTSGRAPSRVAAMRSSVRVVVMGALRLERDGAPVSLPVSGQRVLAFVALRGRPAGRLQVAGTLWPEFRDERATANLRSALWRLGRAAPGVVHANGRELTLADGVEVDAHEAAAVARGVLDPGRPLTRRDVVVLADSDDLLPDWYDDWVEGERERFRQLRIRALERACERLTAEGRLDEALEAGLAAVGADPLREPARRALIELHVASGNGHEAARQLARWTRQAARTLGVGPPADLVEAVSRAAGTRSVHVLNAVDRPGGRA
jgi:DNA-binding SARP family transcriptional activator